MKREILLLLYFSILFNFSLRAQKYTELDSLRGSRHGFRTCYDLNHYHLKLKVDPQTRYLSGSNRLRCTGLEESKILQIDLDEDFDIDQIQTSSGPATWKRKGNSVLVQLPFKIEKGTSFWLEVEYHGHPKPAIHAPWEGGFVWEKDKSGFPWVGVACEGEGSSLWFPSKDQPSDEPDSALLEYEVPKGLTAVGNGQFLDKKPVSDSTTLFRFRVSYPINHYNITFNLGDYLTWSDTLQMPQNKEKLNLSFYALRDDVQKAKTQWGQAKNVLKVLGDFFGPYPFPKDGYKVVQTPYLGMEHQSCIAYGDKFENNAFGFDFILMHETGHEWWGNLVSADDHADMWIHESFCTYSEALFVEKMQGKEKAVQYLLAQKKKIKNKSPVLGNRDVFFNDWKDSDMYYKGTWMLHSFRYFLGNDSIWFKILKDIGMDFGHRPVSSKELVSWISRRTNPSAETFFAQYLTRLNGPVLEYRLTENAGKKVLSFRWKAEEANFQSPVPLQINGKTIRLEATSAWKEMELTEPNALIAANEEWFLYKLKMVP